MEPSDGDKPLAEQDSFFHSDITSAARRFMVELEKRMLEGRTKVDIKRWALEEMGVSEEKFQKLRRLILENWETAGQHDPEAVQAERDELIARHGLLYRKALEVYDEAMQDERYGDASRAIKEARDSLNEIAELKNLKREVTSPVGIILGARNITNATRDRASTLMERMQELAERMGNKHLPKDEVAQIEAPKTNGANGTNGHGVPVADGVTVFPAPAKIKTRRNTIVCLDCKKTRAVEKQTENCECGSHRWRAYREDQDE